MCGVGSTSIFLLLLHVLLVRIIIRGNRVLVVGSLGRHYRCRHIVSGWIDWHSMLCAGFLMVTTVHSKNLSWSPYFPDKLDGVNLYVLYRLQIRIHYIEVAEKQNRTFAVNSRTNHHHNHHLPMNCCNQIVNSKNLSWSPYFPNKSDGVNLYVLYRLQIRIHYIEVAEKKIVPPPLTATPTTITITTCQWTVVTKLSWPNGHNNGPPPLTRMNAAWRRKTKKKKLAGRGTFRILKCCWVHKAIPMMFDRGIPQWRTQLRELCWFICVVNDVHWLLVMFFKG